MLNPERYCVFKANEKMLANGHGPECGQCAAILHAMADFANHRIEAAAILAEGTADAPLSPAELAGRIRTLKVRVDHGTSDDMESPRRKNSDPRGGPARP